LIESRTCNQLSSNEFFKIKKELSNKLEKIKVRVIACGFQQKEGIDYNENSF